MEFRTEVPADLEHVAEQYRAEGFEVTLHPSSDQLPPFAAAFHPEILARNNGLQVLVAVKENQAALKKDPDVSQMAEVVAAQPGWRFDLVVLHGTPERDQVLEEAVEPSLESLLHTLDFAERTAQTGDTTSAFLRAWASLEAALRRTARIADLGEGQQSPQHLLGTLYSGGLLEKSEYDELSHHLRLCNTLVRGLEVPPIDSTIPLYVAGAARKLLAWDGNEQAA